MLELFLPKNSVDDSGISEDAVIERVNFLEKVEKTICSALYNGGRYEARLWLCNTISCIPSISPKNQRHLFLGLLKSDGVKRDFAAQVLRIIFQKSPEKVGVIIAKRSNMLEKFFEGNPQRILQWFDHFGSIAESGHKRGAKAISRYAFINRDVCWEELEWKGKHGQSPAVVATKPHYFHDLDVIKTVENFLEYVPEFWLSDELALSVEDGEILQIDMEFFIDQFIYLMYEVNSKDVWMVIDEFLEEEKFSFLAQHILILLDEHELHDFMESIGNIMRKTVQNEFNHKSSWLEILLSFENGQISLEEFLLLNCVTTQGRQLMRFLNDEEQDDEQRRINEILRSDAHASEALHWSFMKKCSKMSLHMSIKLIGLQSWILHYTLSKECKTKESYESLFSRAGIQYKMVDEYSLVQLGEHSKEYGIEDNYCRLVTKGRCRKKKRKKSYTHYEENSNEPKEFEKPYGQEQLSSVGGSWLLSTDGYSCSWNIADLPEHLSWHYFVRWMKWVHS